MKKFNQILSLYVEDNIDLVKVRLKVDPKDRNIVDYKDFDGYEGYILKEGTYYNVFFLQENLPVLQVPFSIISVTDIEDTNKFDTVKMAALKLLHKKGCLTDSKIRKIGMCNEVEFFEQYLREEGITDSEIKDLYKNNLFENVLTEKVNWGRLAGLAAAGVFAPGYAADVVASKAKEKIGKVFDPKRGIFSDGKDKDSIASTTSSTKDNNTSIKFLPGNYESLQPDQKPSVLVNDLDKIGDELQSKGIQNDLVLKIDSNIKDSMFGSSVKMVKIEDLINVLDSRELVQKIIKPYQRGRTDQVIQFLQQKFP